MVEIIDMKDAKLVSFGSGNSKYANVPSEWQRILNMRDEEGDGVTLELGLLYSEKYGYHLGVWNKEEQHFREDDIIGEVEVEG